MDSFGKKWQTQLNQLASIVFVSNLFICPMDESIWIG